MRTYGHWKQPTGYPCSRESGTEAQLGGSDASYSSKAGPGRCCRPSPSLPGGTASTRAVFGFLCWAVMVEADYLVHTFANVFVRSWPMRLLYRTLAWAHTQLIIAYIMLAVEVRSLSSLWLLCNSYNSVFPMVYCVLLFLLAKRKHKFD